MSHCEHLGQVNNEVRRLVEQGFDEPTIYNRLRTDMCFRNIRRSTVSSLYKFLVNKRNKPKTKKEQKEELKIVKRFCEITDQRNYFVGPIRFFGNASYELRHLTCKWNDRYFFLLNRTRPPTDDIHHVYLFDLYSNKTIGMTFPKQCTTLSGIVHLHGNYGLAFESEEVYSQAKQFSITLVYFDMEKQEFESLQTYECQYHLPKIFVDARNPNKFIVRWIDRGINFVDKIIQTAYWNANGIEFGHPINVQYQLFWNVGSYYQDYVYAFNFATNQLRTALDNGNIHRYNLKKLTYEVVDMRAPGRDFRFAEHNIHSSKVEWIADRVYIATLYPSSNNYGIAWTCFDSPSWTAVNFAVKFPIENMNFVNNSDMIIQVNADKTGQKDKKTEQRYYKISYRTPDYLCNLSWVQLTRTMKNKRVFSPYDKALKYRPLNFNKTIHLLNARNNPDY